MDTKLHMMLAPMVLNLFDNTNVTTDSGMSAEMKTYYDMELIEMAEPELIHDQFGQKRDIPKNGGKKIEFRKYDSLPKALTPLTEGVTPSGRKLTVSTIEATVKQYGDYIELADVLLMTAIDNNLLEASKVLGSQAGRTLDTVTREILNAGTNVQYAEGQVSSRAALVGGSATEASNHYLTVKAVKMAARNLKVMNAPKINGTYVAIIHPDVAFDLTEDPEWKAPHQYVDTRELYYGEIGMIAGVRFMETTEAKVFEGAGAESRDVYSTLFMGDNAYGVTTVTGGGLQQITKQLGSAGTSDPLDQRATSGWKAIKTAEILIQQYLIRVETASRFTDTTTYPAG